METLENEQIQLRQERETAHGAQQAREAVRKQTVENLRFATAQEAEREMRRLSEQLDRQKSGARQAKEALERQEKKVAENQAVLQTRREELPNLERQREAAWQGFQQGLEEAGFPDQTAYRNALRVEGQLVDEAWLEQKRESLEAYHPEEKSAKAGAGAVESGVKRHDPAGACTIGQAACRKTARVGGTGRTGAPVVQSASGQSVRFRALQKWSAKAV